MYTNIQSPMSSPSYISNRSARNSARSAYDSALAASNTRGQSLVGKGFGAASGARGFKQGLAQAQGMTGARSAYQQDYMGSIESNRKAQLASESQRAKEAATLGGLSQQLQDSDFGERLSAAQAQQQLNQAYSQRNQDLGSTALQSIGTLAGLLGMQGSKNSRGMSMAKSLLSGSGGGSMGLLMGLL